MCTSSGTRCHTWVSFELFGVEVCGCLRNPVWLQQLKVPCHQSIFQPTVYIDLPTVKLRCIKNVSHGKFGFIDLALYETEKRSIEVYVKRPILIGNKQLLFEACIQKLVYDHLKSIGFLQGTPRILEIFSLRDGSVCFAMEQIEKACTLDRHLELIGNDHITSVIIDCLLQLLSIVWYLNNVVGINHRDLKPSNFLVLEHDTAKTKVLMIENEIIEISSKYSLTMIDFGFSCIGSLDTHVSDLSLSSVYSRADPCPKEGRDLFLFLGLLYIDFHDRMSRDIRILFESWLDSSGSNLCNFMIKDRQNYKKWLYFIAGNEEILQFRCSPLRILKDLQGL
jgi:serine/threonine protein kinase